MNEDEPVGGEIRWLAPDELGRDMPGPTGRLVDKWISPPLSGRISIHSKPTAASMHYLDGGDVVAKITAEEKYFDWPRIAEAKDRVEAAFAAGEPPTLGDMQIAVLWYARNV